MGTTSSRWLAGITATVVVITIAGGLQISARRAHADDGAPPAAGQGLEVKDPMSPGAVAGAGRLFGRVVDAQGRPIADARVSAWAGTARQLRDAAMVDAQTAEDGRFDMTVPFASVRYTLWVRKSGYNAEMPNVLAGGGQEITVTLRASSRHVLTGAVVDVETGAPVPGAQVLLIGEHGYRRAVRTNETGRFEMQDVPDNIGQGVLFAKANGRVSPFMLLKRHHRYVEVALGPPATLAGVVSDLRSGQPLGGCVVTARPWFMSGFSIQTTTGDDGRFEFTGVPPGKYQVGAFNDNYYEPTTTRGGRLERAEIPLQPGRSGFFRIGLRRMATVKGLVLGSDGQPATDAIVGIKALWESDSRRQWRTTRTDGRGGFTLRTGRLHRRETIEAFSSSDGLGSTKVENLSEGEIRENVTVRLSGAVRVRGVVRDPAGAPIQAVRVTPGWADGDTSDADGRFDLGRIPLPTRPGKGAYIEFLAPRPQRGDLHMWRDDGSRRPARIPQAGARFYHHKQLAFEAQHDEDLTLDVVLEPAELVRFTGKVFDHTGEPVPKADLILLAGNAGAESWKRELHPAVLMGSSSVDSRRRDTALCRTVADEKGQWTICVVRETAEGLKLLSRGIASDASRFSIGAEGPSGAWALVRDIVFEKGQGQKQVDIRLGKGPAEGTISGSVVAPDGRPLAGIQFQTRFPFHRFVTGPDGRFSFPSLGGDTVMVSLRTEGWGVLSPSPGRFGRRFTWEHARFGTEDVRVVLGKSGAVTGTVRWDSGQPVVSFEVSGPAGRLSACNAEGTFRLGEFPPGLHRLNVRTPEGIRGDVMVELEPGGLTEAELILPVADCTIRGQVTDTTGASVPGVTIALCGRACETEVLPDEDGRFAFKVPVGSYELTPRSNDRRSARRFERQTVVVGGDRKEVEVPLVVPVLNPGL